MSTTGQPTPSPSSPSSSQSSGPIHAILEFFSSVKLGITLLFILFVYATIGSAGHYPVIREGGIGWSMQMVRQLRPFELTEFEWFHTWFFIAICALICINVAVTTLRKIPLNRMKLGVWTIHAGVIILAVGSVIYFATKVEGEAPVFRYEALLAVNDNESASLLAVPGTTTTLESPDGPWTATVQSINPNYQLATAGFEGVTDFAITLSLTRPDGSTFFRQLLANHPQFTEDVLPGKGRVKNLPESNGNPIYDPSLTATVAQPAQDTFWITSSWALHLRESGDDNWYQRPIRSGGMTGLPRYNDHLPDKGEVFLPAGARVRVDPIAVPVPATQDNDPLAEAEVRATGFLRYAQLSTRTVPGGDELRPTANITVTYPTGQILRQRLEALNPQRSAAFDGQLSFAWADSEAAFENLKREAQPASIAFIIAGAGAGDNGDALQAVETIAPSDSRAGENAPLKPIGASDWRFRVVGEFPGLEISPGKILSVAVLEIVTPEGETIRRFASSIPGESRDLIGDQPMADPEHGMVTPNPRVQTIYNPTQRGEITIVAGPADDQLRIITRNVFGAVLASPFRPLELIEIARDDAGPTYLQVESYFARGTQVTKPAWIPIEQRNTDVDRLSLLAMAKFEVTRNGETISHWIPFSRYTGPSGDAMALRGTPVNIVPFTFSDGTTIDLVFSRETRPLPQPVVLDDFILTTYDGGFTGTPSIRDWTSIIRFPQSDEGTDSMPVSVNNPAEHAGLWYFQSSWDAPIAPSANSPGSPGLAYTGLGVGNRHGVYTALLGSILTVLGMIYTFYIKPILKRREQERVYRSLSKETRS